MAKFTAYMRGEGTKGQTGNPAGFGNISVSTVSISSNLDANVTINSVTNSPNEAKDFDFVFKIPRGVEAGISTSGHTNTITYSNTATKGSAVITASGPDTKKVFNFNFTLPTGIINGTHSATIHSLNSASTPTVSVTTDSNAIRKKLYFDFGIPVAGFGKPTASITTLSANSNPTVSVSSSGSVTTQVFDFKFGIPSLSKTGYQISFSTASSGSGFSWNGNTLRINRTLTNLYTNIIPINIYKKINSDYKAIAADFKITSSYIEYNADAKFEGYIHCIGV